MNDVKKTLLNVRWVGEVFVCTHTTKVVGGEGVMTKMWMDMGSGFLCNI